MPILRIVITESERAAIEQLANLERRSVEGQVGILIRDTLVRLGLLKKIQMHPPSNSNGEVIVES